MCFFPRRINCCWRKKESLRPNSNSWNGKKILDKKHRLCHLESSSLRPHKFPWKFSDVITYATVKLGVVQQRLQRDQHRHCRRRQILKMKLLKRKRLRKCVIRQVRICRSGKQNLSKIASFWLHIYKACEIYWRRKHERSKIMKMEAPGGKSCVLFVTLQDTTRTNAAMVHVKEFPSATTAINIKKLEQEYQNLWKWSGKKSQRMNLTRERVASSFFAMMRPRLRKQIHVKYVDQSALHKDLMILKNALGDRIPLDERIDLELSYIIER